MSIEFYNQNAQQFFDNTVDVDMTPLYDRFLEGVPEGGSVLDAGCGSGRDSKAFFGKGYQVTAFDASGPLVSLAKGLTGIEVQQRTFEQVTEQEVYDGIWCCASLLHVNRDKLPETMQRLSDSLKPNGCWYLSFKYGLGERQESGRYFCDLNEQGLDQLIGDLGSIHINSVWVTEDRRPGRDERWLNAILVKAGS